MAFALPVSGFADWWGNEARESAPANVFLLDTEDPLYMGNQGDFLFQTFARISDGGVFSIGEDVQIGLNDRLAFLFDIQYQQDFNGSEDGFSGPGFGLMYRSGTGPLISDLYGGIRLAGNQKVPEFSNNTWYVGTRMGRQWSWVTLAAALESSWIFDESMGMAYFDFMPEAYFRIYQGFSAGVGADLRKSTNPAADREWVNLKLSQRFGYTMYTVFSDYEFEMQEWRFGFRLNLLF